MNNLVSNVVYLISEKFFTMFIMLLSNIVIIRHLGIEDFGRLAIFQIYFSLAVTVSEFGIRRVYSSFRTALREQMVFNCLLQIKIFLSFVFILLLFSFVYFFNYDRIYYFLAFAFLSSPMETYCYHYELNLKNQFLSKVRVIVSVALALLRIVLCFFSVDLILIILSFSINNLLVNLICYFYSRNNIHSIPIKSQVRKNIIIKHVFSRSLFFWISVVLVQLNLRTDQFILSFMVGAAGVGIYAGAYKIIEQFMLIPSILAGVFLPHISKMDSVNREEYLGKLYSYSFAISLIICFACVLLAPIILPLLLGDVFIKSIPIFQILAMSLPVLILVNLSGLFYSIYKLERYAVIRNLFGLLTSIILNVFFIRLWGPLGAATSVLISYSFVAFLVEALVPITRINATLKVNAVKDTISLKVYKELIDNAKIIIFKKK